MNAIHVTAPSRLHFGMFSFGQADVRQFGGVGVMIDQPGLRLRIEPAVTIQAEGPLAERAIEFARRVVRRLDPTQSSGCRIRILSAPPQHVGLGVGTALGMSVAAGLCRLWRRGDRSVAELATLAGRGERSAVGAHGFLHGGLIIEAGKQGEQVAPLVSQVSLPEAWRFVLVRPNKAQGLSGESETTAFTQLPPVPHETTAALCREALLGLAPAAREGCCDAFGESLYRFGRMAGECFTTAQGGPYASSQLEELVDTIRRFGFPGVGQSSWGPTLFALAESVDRAEQLHKSLNSRFGGDLIGEVTTIARRGAVLEVS
jgi:beta-RFAP synthase